MTTVNEEEVEAAIKAACNKFGDAAMVNTCHYPKCRPCSTIPAIVRAALKAAAKVREEQRLRDCKHPRKIGSGSISCDGSSKSRWYCPECGASGSSETPPRLRETPASGIE